MTFVTYAEGVARQEQWKREAERYVPYHSPEEHARFLRANLSCIKFEAVHPQSENYRAAYCLFTVQSQHVYGNCMEELLDKAIRAASNRAIG